LFSTVDRCGECGFVYDLEGSSAAAGAIREGAERIAALVEGAGGDGRNRGEPDTWSPLEYGCHVRDVLLVQRERVLAALRVDTPQPEPMGRDERVVDDGYADQDPVAVARQLRDAALLFTNVLDRLDDLGWERTLIYNYPERTERSLRWVAVHTRHEVEHHLADIEIQLPRR
jgi:hypothetical protein